MFLNTTQIFLCTLLENFSCYFWLYSKRLGIFFLSSEGSLEVIGPETVVGHAWLYAPSRMFSCEDREVPRNMDLRRLVEGCLCASREINHR